MADISADSVARTFVSGWVARFGVPSTITTDRGRQFESHLWRAFTELLGCHHLRTTAYQPSANGMVERFHRQLKASLKAKTPVQWTDSLPMTLLGIRTALKHDLQCSVAELVYGSTLRWEFFQQSPPFDDPASLVGRLKNTMPQLWATHVCPQPQQKVHIDKELSSCTHVFVRKDSVRKPIQPPYDGPYRVLSREHKYFELDLNGRQDTVSVDRLKPAHLDAASVM